MAIELPEFLDFLFPNAVSTLLNAHRTFRTFVCGAGAAATFLLVASTAQAQDTDPSGWLGLDVADYNEAGAIVEFVYPNGPAQKAGLVTGDTIISFDSMQATKANLYRVLTLGNRITMHLRHNKVRTVTAVIGSAEQTPAEFPVIGKPAPQLTPQRWLNTPAGKTMGKTTTFGDGHVYVLDFTAILCHACPAMYPIMENLKQQYAARGLRIMYVMGQNDESEIAEYTAKHHMSAPVAWFATGGQLALIGYWNILKSRYDGYDGYQVGFPQIVLIDGTGTVRAKGQEEDFAKEVASAVAASHPKTP